MVQDKKKINDQLKKLEDIATWFDDQEEVDVEEGLKKVKEGAVLVKELKIKLKEVENEFEEIKKELE
jgi:exonuclease VII small subunit